MSPNKHAHGGFNEKVKRAIPCDHFYMISSSQDHQQSEEAYNATAFELPNPAGKSGGACSSAWLQVLYDNADQFGEMSWVDVLQAMRVQLKTLGYDQIPNLSSSRWIDINQPMHICPPGSGRRRAILIGINYVGQNGELKSCHNDVANLKDYLVKAQGFDPTQMLILMDDGKHSMPTKANIEKAFGLMTQYSQPGDVVFASFSGHGGNVVDRSGDEEDGFDETLIPVDFMEAGHIVDDDILDMFVKPMRKGVSCTVLMDCCHSGTVLDLPYNFNPEENNMTMEKNFQFDDPAVVNADDDEDEDNKSDSSSVNYGDNPVYNVGPGMNAKPPVPTDQEESTEEDEDEEGKDSDEKKKEEPTENDGEHKTTERKATDLPPPPPQCCVLL